MTTAGNEVVLEAVEAPEGDPTPSKWVQRLVPPALDLAAAAGFLFLVPWLGARIFEQSPVCHVFLLPGFLLMLVGVYAIRSLPSYSLRDSEGPGLLGMCLIFFQMVTYSLLYVYATNLGGSESQNDGIAVLIFFVLLPLFIAAFKLPAPKTARGSKGALVAQSIGLFSVNYLTLIGAAVWTTFFSLPVAPDAVYATGFSFVVLYVLIYLLFLAFFGLPRLYLLRATGDRLGLTIYLLTLAIFLWDKVPPIG